MKGTHLLRGDGLLVQFLVQLFLEDLQLGVGLAQLLPEDGHLAGMLLILSSAGGSRGEKRRISPLKLMHHRTRMGRQWEVGRRLHSKLFRHFQPKQIIKHNIRFFNFKVSQVHNRRSIVV